MDIPVIKTPDNRYIPGIGGPDRETDAAADMVSAEIPVDPPVLPDIKIVEVFFGYGFKFCGINHNVSSR
jgi:hypothetical protein